MDKYHRMEYDYDPNKKISVFKGDFKQYLLDVGVDPEHIELMQKKS